MKNNHKMRTRCEIWTRITGYYRPIISCNLGKKSEFFDRKKYHISSMYNSAFAKKYAKCIEENPDC